MTKHAQWRIATGNRKVRLGNRKVRLGNCKVRLGNRKVRLGNRKVRLGNRKVRLEITKLRQKKEEKITCQTTIVYFYGIERFNKICHLSQTPKWQVGLWLGWKILVKKAWIHVNPAYDATDSGVGWLDFVIAYIISYAIAKL